MALQGTLDSFSLPDVLRLLADTGKTGRLQIEGDRGQGSVWIDDGSIVAAGAERALSDAPVDEIIFELLRFSNGSFVFAADETAPDGEEPADVEVVLRRATELLDEWRELESVVPSLDHRVAIAPQLTVDKVTVDAARWTTLVALAGGVSVGELGETLGLGELAVSRTVSDLVELGVAVIGEPETRPRRSVGANRRSRPERRGPKVNGQREPARHEDPADGYEPLAPDSSPRAGWMRDDGPVPVGGSGRSGGGQDADLPSPRVARGATNGRGDDAVRGEDPGAGNDLTSGNGLPRRSRSTGQRSGGRQVGGNGMASLPPSSNPPSSPFANGSVMPAPTSGPGLTGLPPFNNNDEPSSLLSASLDTGPLGPSPLMSDSAPGSLVAPSSLPADLSWATDDDEDVNGPALGSVHSPPLGIPPVVPPAPASLPGASGRGAAPIMNPAPAPISAPAPMAPPLAEGETAPHVAVLSPNAQMAVEATVGRSGGGPGVVAASGVSQEEAIERGTLLGFLSSVRQ